MKRHNDNDDDFEIWIMVGIIVAVVIAAVHCVG